MNQSPETSVERIAYRKTEGKRLLTLALAEINSAILATELANEHIDTQELYEACTFLATAKKRITKRISEIIE